MPAKHLRLKVPENVLPETAGLHHIRENLAEYAGDREALTEVYGAKNPKKAREQLMLELLADAWSDPSRPPTLHKVQCAIVNEFRKITGSGYNTAKAEFDVCQERIKGVLNIGSLVNYAATVKTDLLHKLYLELNPEETKNKKGEVVEPKLPGINHRLGIYRLMLEAADSISNLGLKQEVNEINREKNVILDKKVDSDTRIGVANVALQVQGLSREEKERAAIEAFLSDKTLLNPIMDQITDGDDFRAEVVDEDDD